MSKGNLIVCFSETKYGNVYNSITKYVGESTLMERFIDWIAYQDGLFYHHKGPFKRSIIDELNNAIKFSLNKGEISTNIELTVLNYNINLIIEKLGDNSPRFQSKNSHFSQSLFVSVKLKFIDDTDYSDAQHFIMTATPFEDLKKDFPSNDTRELDWDF